MPGYTRSFLIGSLIEDKIYTIWDRFGADSIEYTRLRGVGPEELVRSFTKGPELERRVRGRRGTRTTRVVMAATRTAADAVYVSAPFPSDISELDDRRRCQSVVSSGEP